MKHSCLLLYLKKWEGTLEHDSLDSFVKLYHAISPLLVTEFSYRYSNDIDAHIYMSLELEDRDRTLLKLISDLESKGMKATDASYNEMAKSHGRFLVGGCFQVQNERFFRFSFPERPGALGRFLEILPSDVNGEVTKRLILN